MEASWWPFWMTLRTPSSAITIILPHLVDHMTGYLLEVKYFPMTLQKSRGGVSTTPPPPPLIGKID